MGDEESVVLDEGERRESDSLVQLPSTNSVNSVRSHVDKKGRMDTGFLPSHSGWKRKAFEDEACPFIIRQLIGFELDEVPEIAKSAKKSKKVFASKIEEAREKLRPA